MRGKMFAEIIAENFPKIIKDLYQIQEPQSTQTGFKNKQKLDLLLPNS